MKLWQVRFSDEPLGNEVLAGSCEWAAMRAFLARVRRGVLQARSCAPAEVRLLAERGGPDPDAPLEHVHADRMRRLTLKSVLDGNGDLVVSVVDSIEIPDDRRQRRL